MHKTKRLKMIKMMLLLSGLTLTVFAIAQEKKQVTQIEPAAITLPAEAKSYVDFYRSAQFTFAIDLDSISIPPGEEKEIRYTLKASSKEGAINISYEGIRCDNHQKILYAIGGEDGNWARVSEPKWSAISKTGINEQQTSLANEYFCDGNALSGNVKSIRDRIQWKRPLGSSQ